MNEENGFYASIIIIFAGFLIFAAALLSKSIDILLFLSPFYVLVVLLGILLGIFGGSMLLSWHVRNRRPFQSGARSSFSSYLSIGILLIFIGMIFSYFFSKGQRHIFFISMVVSITGIALLIIGLKGYLREFSRRMMPHS